MTHAHYIIVHHTHTIIPVVVLQPSHGHCPLMALMLLLIVLRMSQSVDYGGVDSAKVHHLPSIYWPTMLYFSRNTSPGLLFLPPTPFIGIPLCCIVCESAPLGDWPQIYWLFA